MAFAQTIIEKSNLALPRIAELFQKKVNNEPIDAPRSTIDRIIDEFFHDCERQIPDNFPLLDKIKRSSSNVSSSEILEQFKGLTDLEKEANVKLLEVMWKVDYVSESHPDPKLKFWFEEFSKCFNNEPSTIPIPLEEYEIEIF